MAQPRLEAFDCATDNLEQYTCSNCPSFSTHFLTHLTEHVENGHTTESSNVLKAYKCEHCGFKAHSKYIALKHNLLKCPALNSPDRWFHCRHCPTKYKSKTGLHAHVKSEHTFISDDDWLHCYECGFCTIFECTMKQHMWSVHSKKPFSWYHCGKCNFKTKAKGTLKKHIGYKHLPEDQVKWFHCEQCPSKFKVKYNLRMHILTKHTTVQEPITWHYCDICNVRFKIKRSLKKHMIDKHLPMEKLPQFRCKECSFITFQSQVLQEHVVDKHRTEEHTQWFQCDKCPAIKDEHQDNVFQCKKCSCKTRNLNEFMRHSLIHSMKKVESSASSLASEIRTKWKLKMSGCLRQS